MGCEWAHCSKCFRRVFYYKKFGNIGTPQEEDRGQPELCVSGYRKKGPSILGMDTTGQSATLIQV